MARVFGLRFRFSGVAQIHVDVNRILSLLKGTQRRFCKSACCSVFRAADLG